LIDNEKYIKFMVKYKHFDFNANYERQQLLGKYNKINTNIAT